jgi:PAS domain S-box-containing protein
MNDTDVINITIERERHTVLVVDDNAATRYSTGRVLRAAGFPVIEAANGRDAIERSKQGVSAVILDVHLPDMDGFEVCRAIRARGSTEMLPVIHLSATHVASEDRVTGLNAGGDAYLVHPAEPAVLIATLQALIRARTAEDKQRRVEQRFRAIYDHAQSGIALIDRNGCFADANPAMQRLLALRQDEIVGRPVVDFTPPEWRDTAAAIAGTAGSWHGEFPLAAKDGRRVFFDWNVSQPIDHDLRVATLTDISERHELEQRRREVLEREQAARAAAEQHSRTKDNFIAVLSHELRTPLNAIVGWVAVLMRRNPTPEAMKGLEAIERNVKAQARLISDILDVSRINSGKLRLELEHVDPAEVVRTSIAGLQASIAERKIDVRMDLDPAFTDASIDPNRFQQVVWNLMTNAIKFSPMGGPVDVMLRREGGNLVLSVRDEGQGIAPDFLPRLFDRFTQSDEPGNRMHGGLGLGLSIVKHIVDLHGGTVTAHSAGTGMGTTMRVELPIGEQQDTSAQHEDFKASAGGPEAEAMARPLEGRHSLVVADVAGSAEMLSVVLSDRGARVRTAPDYETALRALVEDWPDAMVSDIGLPGRDGYELLRAARALTPPAGRPSSLPAIALTAFARPEDRKRAIDSGFDAHVAKPLKPLALVTALLSVAPVRRRH